MSNPGEGLKNPKVPVLFGAAIVGVIFFLLAFLVFGKTLMSMACVILGISVVGWAIGNLMDTSCPASPKL
jgi:Flp pilus assembly protein TadB